MAIIMGGVVNSDTGQCISGNENDLWIEYKFLRSHPRELRWKGYLSKLQLRWATERTREGRNVWVAFGYLGSAEGILIRSSRTIFRGPTLKPHIQTVKEIAHEINHFCGVL